MGAAWHLLARPRMAALPLALAAVVLLHAPGVLRGAAAQADAFLDDAEMLPWEYQANEGHFRWEGLQNDLPALLKAQAKDNAVALVVFNAGFAPIALNCIVSLVRFGRAHNYVVAAVGDASVQHCVELRLPCYNASALVPPSKATEGDTGRNSREWFNLVWSKTLVTDAIFMEGYDVLFFDADIVFIKEAFPVYNRFLDEYDADGTFMMEARYQNNTNGTTYLNKYLNSGNFFLRNNFRTREMMTEWMVGATPWAGLLEKGLPRKHPLLDRRR
ncbi:MAG: nucleotide-diphospho-sugar transferase-domain-containing protein [Monoraphidium minutum]|nr:MAG: nucleotide-diphospho-sugar transferase-domain-containing protein [Monoraphidium minutum]